jgi:hypothetical protein
MAWLVFVPHKILAKPFVPLMRELGTLEQKLAQMTF